MAAIGLGFLSLFLLIVVAVFLTLLRNFFARAAALEELSVRESLQIWLGHVQAQLEERRADVAGDGRHRDRVWHCRDDRCSSCSSRLTWSC